jgi:hypothetical protein
VPRIESKVVVNASIADAFALSQSQGDVRYAWDPFVSEQWLLDDATRPDRGVKTFTRSRHRLAMVSEYTAFRPPKQVGMKMVSGPWFFSTFGGGWSFRSVDDQTTEATWRYTFSGRPRWLAPIIERIGNVLLGRDIDRRLAAFAKACENPELVRSATAQLAGEES